MKRVSGIPLAEVTESVIEEATRFFLHHPGAYEREDLLKESMVAEVSERFWSGLREGRRNAPSVRIGIGDWHQADWSYRIRTSKNGGKTFFFVLRIHAEGGRKASLLIFAKKLAMDMADKGYPVLVE